MKIFLDTADIEEIRVAARWGVLDGVTTNPTLYAKVGGASYESILEEICKLTSGPVSAEVVAEDVEGMLKEGRHFAKIAPNIVVKIPMSEEGLEAMSRLAEEGISTNCTLIFSANQGLLAAKAGASILSPFVGRLDDINEDGMAVTRDLVNIIEIDLLGQARIDCNHLFFCQERLGEIVRRRALRIEPEVADVFQKNAHRRQLVVPAR